MRWRGALACTSPARHKRLFGATTPTDRKLHQRRIQAIDQEIDALVYDLYGLTEEEIGIVEGRT